MAIDKETYDTEFQRGQDYEKHIHPFNTPGNVFDSEEVLKEKVEAFEDGRRSIQNDPNQR